MEAKVWVGIVGAIIFTLGFLGIVGSSFTGSPYGDLYIAMMFIGAVMVGAVKFLNWLKR